MAKVYGVAPVMMLTTLSQSMEEEIKVAHSILTSKENQNRLFDNVLSILKTKGYSGVSINTPYILPMDRGLYEDFVIDYANRLSNEGFKLYDTFSIRIFQLLSGTIFVGLDYSKISKEVDGFTLISYVFGYSEGVPPGTISIDTFRRFIEFSAKFIPPEKISVGVPVIGYVWKLPYIPNESKGMSISYDSAIEIALNQNAEIQYDEVTSTAYFQYIAVDEFFVRFWDARSVDSYVKLVPEVGINGVGIWNIMNWFPQMWLVINSQYEIDKVL
jgi:spore germination protein